MNDAEMFMRSSMGRMVVPALLLRGICQLAPVKEIVHLGCGAEIFDTHIATLMEYQPELERVYLYDPTAKYSCVLEETRPLPEVLVNVEPPVGTPVIALHPGFSLSLEHMFDIVKCPTEPWDKTLQRLRPRYLSFSSYSEDEMMSDLAYLVQNTDLMPFAHFNDPLTEHFRLSKTEGIGFSMSLMGSADAILHLEQSHAATKPKREKATAP